MIKEYKRKANVTLHQPIGTALILYSGRRIPKDYDSIKFVV